MILKTVLQENHWRDSIIPSTLDVVSLILYLTLQELHTLFSSIEITDIIQLTSTVTPGSIGSGYGNGTGATENLYTQFLVQTPWVKVTNLESRSICLVN